MIGNLQRRTNKFFMNANPYINTKLCWEMIGKEGGYLFTNASAFPPFVTWHNLLLFLPNNILIILIPIKMSKIRTIGNSKLFYHLKLTFLSVLSIQFGNMFQTYTCLFVSDMGNSGQNRVPWKTQGKEWKICK